MKTNYQFGFNADLNYLEEEQKASISTFLRDLFPYWQMQSITFGLSAIQVLWLILSIGNLTILPTKTSETDEENVFNLLASFLVSLVLVGRLGSEYEAKLGCKYFLTVVIIIQVQRFLLTFIMGFYAYGLIIVNNSSLFSFYVLSMINIQKWKQNQMPQYQTKEKVVQNYDLLDLNDTVIKLRPNESQFMYESYTNREFYFHNLTNKEQRSSKTTGKSTKKIKRSSKFVEETTSETEYHIISTFKICLAHFIVFSLYPTNEFIIFTATQITIYALFVTKALKRLVFI